MNWIIEKSNQKSLDLTGKTLAKKSHSLKLSETTGSDECMRCTKIFERRSGIEPANTGFADLRVDRFATGAYQANSILPDTPIHAIRPCVNPAGHVPDFAESGLL